MLIPSMIIIEEDYFVDATSKRISEFNIYLSFPFANYRVFYHDLALLMFVMYYGGHHRDLGDSIEFLAGIF